MALDPLSDEEMRCIVESGRCLLHGAISDAPVAQTTIAETAEALVSALQSRIAELEVALAQARKAVGPQTVATPRPRPATTSAGWGDGDATFEERIAAKAFFRPDTVDESSRRWLLDQS